jgi:hypothetical protein
MIGYVTFVAYLSFLPVVSMLYKTHLSLLIYSVAHERSVMTKKLTVDVLYHIN